MKSEFEIKFEEGIILRNEEKFDEAIEILLNLVKDYPESKDLYIVHTILSGIYLHSLEDFKQSRRHGIKAVLQNKEYELASQLVYLSHIELKDYDIAIREMNRFLRNNPAKLYEETIQELLDGLEKGYMTNYKEMIFSMAKRNGFNVTE